jgi:hypothetical protein
MSGDSRSDPPIMMQPGRRGAFPAARINTDKKYYTCTSVGTEEPVCETVSGDCRP